MPLRSSSVYLNELIKKTHCMCVFFCDILAAEPLLFSGEDEDPRLPESMWMIGLGGVREPRLLLG